MFVSKRKSPDLRNLLLSSVPRRYSSPALPRPNMFRLPAWVLFFCPISVNSPNILDRPFRCPLAIEVSGRAAPSKWKLKYVNPQTTASVQSSWATWGKAQISLKNASVHSPSQNFTLPASNKGATVCSRIVFDLIGLNLWTCIRVSLSNTWIRDWPDAACSTQRNVAR